jgi:HEPN domain-containing protein
MNENQNESKANASMDETDRLEEYREWLAFAQTDYNCAAYLNQAPFHPRPLNVICYHCQQAAEKAIKALIVFFGSQGGMPKVHDLSFLLNQVKKIMYEQKGLEISRDFMEMADGLSKYGVAPRYPNEIEVDEFQTAKALKNSAIILDWIRQVIAEEPLKK